MIFFFSTFIIFLEVVFSSGIIQTEYGNKDCEWYSGVTFFFDGLCCFEGYEFPMEAKQLNYDPKTGNITYLKHCFSETEPACKQCEDYSYLVGKCYNNIDPSAMFSYGEFPERKKTGFVYNYYYQNDFTCSKSDKIVQAEILDFTTCVYYGDGSQANYCNDKGVFGTLTFSDRKCQDYVSFEPFKLDCNRVATDLEFYSIVACDKRV